MRAPVVALLCFAGAISTSCGSSSSDAPRGTTTPGSGARAAAITIEVPRDGARLKAKEGKGGTLRVRARVRGRAEPGSALFLSAACRPKPCRAEARAGDDGRWATMLTLKAPPAASFVTIDANAQRDVVAVGSAVATVELVGPAPPQAQRRRAERESRGSPGAGAASGSGSSARSQPRGPTRRTPSRPPLPRDVLVIGDSLALGIEQPLRAALPGWRVRVDGRIGRPLAEGMRILGSQSSPPAILAFSLFTNDDPRNTGALAAAVRSTALRPGSCVVWSTVVRPPLNGVSYDAANALLRRLGNDPELALGLQVVDWAAEVARSPSLIAGDNVHATPAGYSALAVLYASAIRSCAR